MFNATGQQLAVHCIHLPASASACYRVDILCRYGLPLTCSPCHQTNNPASVVTWFRFRQVRKTTRSALMSNSTATARSDRAKRKLYLMAVSILIPYLPLTVAFFVASIIDYMPLVPYSYNRIHYDNDPYPWDTIFMAPSSEINFTYLNANYIPIITAVPIFWFFGLTKDAINTYRTYLLALGFGKLFPSLREEYDPDRPRTSANASHWGSSVTTQP